MDESKDTEEAVLCRIVEIIKLHIGVIPLAKKNINKYKTKMIDNHNKKSKVAVFRVDDLVMVLDRGASDLATSLLPKWLGPFRISEVVGKDVYIVQDGLMKFPYAFHANHLKLYKSRPRLSATLKFYSSKLNLQSRGDVMLCCDRAGPDVK